MIGDTYFQLSDLTLSAFHTYPYYMLRFIKVTTLIKLRVDQSMMTL